MSAIGTPQQIGSYMIERELGRGAFGVVYRAYPEGRPDEAVALKVIEGRGNTDRLLLEPAVLSRLEHPCIVGLRDYFLNGDDLVMAMEFIDGQDLKDLLEEGATFSDGDIRDLLIQVGSALEAAHSQNIVHRDLKPANILVQRRPEGGYRFVLTDFGIGQVREGIQDQKHTGGTYLFMAPEQLRGRPGPQSDLWALGVVAYRLLTGRLPFPGPTLRELTQQILYGAVKPPGQVAGRVIDAQLEGAVLRLLDKSLQERTASASELLKELGHKTSTKIVTVPTSSKSGRSGGEDLDRRIQRGLWQSWVLLVVCLVVYLLPGNGLPSLPFLVGMWVFYHSQRQDRWKAAERILLLLAAYLLFGTSVVFTWAFKEYDVFTSQMWGYWLGAITKYGGPAGPFVILLLFWGVYVMIPGYAGVQLSRMRRLRRERLLRDVAREEGTTSERYLQALRESLDTRFEDVGLHQKYAETLFARGRVQEAAVEARLLLRQDPYNFAGNLLLATTYQTLGLDRECIEVCDRYLEVAGYCFEFADLRESCLRRALS